MAEHETIDRDGVVFDAAQRWRLKYSGADAMVAALRIQRAYAAMTAEINRLLAHLDLNSVRYEILSYVALSDSAVVVKDLSDWLMVHPTSVTHNVDKLEASGYVHREPNPNDRRSTVIGLTSRGSEVMEEATAIAVEHRFGMSEIALPQMVQIDRILRQIPMRL